MPSGAEGTADTMRAQRINRIDQAVARLAQDFRLQGAAVGGSFSGGAATPSVP
jgi:hypothetical protein